MAAVFISYRKLGEDKASALHLAEDLRESLGQDAVFLDERGLGLGRFDDQLAWRHLHRQEYPRIQVDSSSRIFRRYDIYRGTRATLRPGI